MIGFGFMDNLVMIQAGELIDSTIGVKFGLATMTAAAFGQVFSDVSGVAFGGVVDTACQRMGLPVSNLTAQQRTLPVVQRLGTLAAIGGVICGCLLGMSCLLFMDLEHAEREKRAHEVDGIFRKAMSRGATTIGADRCSLFIVDPKNHDVWTKVATGLDADDHVVIRMPRDVGFVGSCVNEKRMINVADAYEDPRFNAAIDRKNNYHTKQILCCPVLHENGDVEAVVELINTLDGEPFGETAEKCVQLLAEHIAVFMAQA